MRLPDAAALLLDLPLLDFGFGQREQIAFIAEIGCGRLCRQLGMLRAEGG